MSELEDAAEACCGHPLSWHHGTRGCGYLGFSDDHRCLCVATFYEALALHDDRIRAEAVQDAAVNLPLQEKGQQYAGAAVWLLRRAAAFRAAAGTPTHHTTEED